MDEIGPGIVLEPGQEPAPGPDVEQVPLHLRPPHAGRAEGDGAREDPRPGDPGDSSDAS